MSPRPRQAKHLRNAEIAERFEAMADMLAMQSANPFRVRAYQNAARTLRRYGVEAADLIAQGQDLSELPGIGEDLAGKIGDFAKTGTTDLYEELKGQTPPLAFSLMQLPGMGPKRVHTLLTTLKIKSINDLRRAARAGQVREVAGFGTKAEAALLASLDKAKAPARRPISAATGDANTLAAYLNASPAVEHVVVAGSFRRGRESVGDLDLVVSSRAPSKVMAHFKDYSDIDRISAAGPTRSTVVMKSGLQVDLRVVTPESFGSALLYFTGSKAHNLELRGIAKARGLKLNEYGLYRGERRLAGRTEAEIYEKLGLGDIPPELREARGEIEAARTHALPPLVERRDIKGDFHVRNEGQPIEPVVEAARAQGLSYLVIVSLLDGASSLKTRRTELAKLQRTVPRIRLLLGLETEILPDGRLAGSEESLRKADLVYAAVNSAVDLPREQQTLRLLTAIRNPLVTALARPTCRIINRREPLDADWRKIIEEAARLGVALELSGDPDRLDLTDVHCRMARDLGAGIIIGSEARAPEELGRIDIALMQARRGWLEARHILNTMPIDRVLKRLRKKSDVEVVV